MTYQTIYLLSSLLMNIVVSLESQRFKNPGFVQCISIQTSYHVGCLSKTPRTWSCLQTSQSNSVLRCSPTGKWNKRLWCEMRTKTVKKKNINTSSPNELFMIKSICYQVMNIFCMFSPGTQQFIFVHSREH